MHRLMSAAILIAICTGTVPAQEKKPNPVIEFREDGMLFPVHLELDKGKKKCRQIRFTGNTKGRGLMIETNPGPHTVEVANWRLGFPQSATYTITEGGKEVWKSEPTVDPRHVLLQPGQRLVVTIHRPYESYNSKFCTFKGIACGINFPRPYWFQDVEKKWEGTEDYPNSLFFLCDTDKWGPRKTLAELTRHVIAERTRKAAPHGDYRCKCHVSFIFALNPDGSVPKALLDATEKELNEAITQAYDQWLKEKCYRTFPADAVAQLKKAGYLPADTKDGALHVPVSRGVQLASELLPAWTKRQKELKDK